MNADLDIFFIVWTVVLYGFISYRLIFQRDKPTFKENIGMMLIASIFITNTPLWTWMKIILYLIN